MRTLSYQWRAGDAEHELRLVPVTGTAGRPYLFGAEPNRRPVEIQDFHMTSTPVTQVLWTHVMGSNPAMRADLRCPVENISWDHITGAAGFLERINSSEVLAAVAGPGRTLRFRLPSETEWEYAARGGPHWTDGFQFSGSNDADAVAWYGRRWSRLRRFGVQLFGWRIGWRLFSKGNLRKPSRTHDVATKAPNQLGLYDMCGNVWEWCEDAYVGDIDAVPRDGRPWPGQSPDRRLRSGCHHNWDIHCTVWFRYAIRAGRARWVHRVSAGARAARRARSPAAPVRRCGRALRLVEAPGNVLIPAKSAGLPKDSVASVTQVITVDRDFLSEPAGRVRGQLLKDVDHGLRLVLAL